MRRKSRASRWKRLVLRTIKPQSRTLPHSTSPACDAVPQWCTSAIGGITVPTAHCVRSDMIMSTSPSHLPSSGASPGTDSKRVHTKHGTARPSGRMKCSRKLSRVIRCATAHSHTPLTTPIIAGTRYADQNPPYTMATILSCKMACNNFHCCQSHGLCSCLTCR